MREGYTIATYGDRIAGVYDSLYGEDERGVAVLKELARDGKALELGIGTGRIAVPLARSGVPVDGVDASQEMLNKLREKVGSQAVHARLGDFSDLSGWGTYRLVFVVVNTFFMLTTQEEQIRCFSEVAGHLEPGGAFLIEAFVPDPARLAQGQRISIYTVETDHVRMSFQRHQLAEQIVEIQNVFLQESGIKMYPGKLRYIWPSEMDLMARLAGLRLESRWGDWDKSAFTDASTKHVSVYRKG